MRKTGENSVKRAGKSAIPPDKNNDFTLVSKVNNPSHLDDFAPIAIVLRWKPLLQLEGFLPPGHWARHVAPDYGAYHWI
jgi:hypothetical protein